MGVLFELEVPLLKESEKERDTQTFFQRFLSSTRSKMFAGILALGHIAGTANSHAPAQAKPPAEVSASADTEDAESEKEESAKEPDWNALRKELGSIRTTQRDMINDRHAVNGKRSTEISEALEQAKQWNDYRSFWSDWNEFIAKRSNYSALYNLEGYRRVQKEGEDFLLSWEEKLELESEIEDHAKFEERYQQLIEKQAKLVICTIDTPEKLYVFLKDFMKYTPDDSDQDGYIDEYWQTWSETLQRMKNGKFLGDCDDYAFLARYILRHHGYEAHVMRIPKHAFCIWVKKDENSRFHASSIDTKGLDQNGDLYGDDKDDQEAKKGFDTLEEAVNSVRRRFKDLFKNGAFEINPGKIYLSEIPSFGKQDDWIQVHPDILLEDVDPGEKLEREK